MDGEKQQLAIQAGSVCVSINKYRQMIGDDSPPNSDVHQRVQLSFTPTPF